MEERRQKGRKGEEEGWKGGEKEGREERRKGREGGRLDMGPDMSESCSYNDVLTFYKVSELSSRKHKRHFLSSGMLATFSNVSRLSGHSRGYLLTDKSIFINTLFSLCFQIF